MTEHLYGLPIYISDLPEPGSIWLVGPRSRLTLTNLKTSDIPQVPDELVPEDEDGTV